MKREQFFVVFVALGFVSRCMLNKISQKGKPINEMLTFIELGLCLRLSVINKKNNNIHMYMKNKDTA